MIIKDKIKEERQKTEGEQKTKNAYLRNLKKEEDEARLKREDREDARTLKELSKKKKYKKELPKFSDLIPEIVKIAEEITVPVLKQKIDEWAIKYDPPTQLLLIVEYFMEIFGKTPSLFEKFDEDKKAEEPTWSTRSIPYSLISQEAIDYIVEWISHFSKDEIKDWIWFSYDTFVKIQLALKYSKHSTTGLWAILQIIARRFPQYFPLIIADIQSNYMELDQDMYIIKKKDKAYIFPLLGNVLQSNPKIALYCWFELLFPSLQHGSHRRVEDDIVNYIDFTVKNKKNYTSSEIGDDLDKDQLQSLLDFVFNNSKSSKYHDQFPDILKNLMECTVFRKSKTPRLYFKSLLTFANTILSKKVHNDKSEVNFILNTLAVSLLKDPECHAILIDNYHLQLSDCSAVILHLGSNWDKLGKLNTSPETTQALITTCKTLITTNQQIIESKFVRNNKIIGPKTLGLKPEQLSKMSNSYESLLKKSSEFL